MNFSKVTKENIDILYEMNHQLAVDEGQGTLFTAKRENYRDCFLSECPVSFGFLCHAKSHVIGFYVYFLKFASYLGSKVFYIEDIYLIDKFRNRKNKYSLIQHAIEQSKNNDCCRVELRVLKTFNIGYDIISDIGFNRIEKWDVFRFEHI